MFESRQESPPGWHYDEDAGALMRDVAHRMGRRCHNWDYCRKGIYLITLTLADRRSCALGQLRHDAQKGAFVELNAVGRLVEATMAELPHQWPGVEVLGLQVMPDHLHAVIAVRARLRKPLGAIVGSFKSKATSRWLKLGRTRPSATVAGPLALGATARAPSSLFAEGYVDTILFDAAAVAHARAYLAENPRRIWEKRAHPELFVVLHDLPVSLGAGFVGHFAAIGNHNLLKAHTILQVQCSRRFFAYARAAGNLLMLAPINWPYLPGEKKMTRVDACVLNRLAQWIAGPGADEIIYKGIQPEAIDRLARDAVGQNGNAPYAEQSVGGENT